MRFWRHLGTLEVGNELDETAEGLFYDALGSITLHYAVIDDFADWESVKENILYYSTSFVTLNNRARWTIQCL